MGKYIFIIALTAAVSVGLVISFGDYRAWKYEETHLLGHGSGVVEPTTPVVLEFTQPYRSSVLGFRFRYPKEWKVTKEDTTFTIVDPKRPVTLLTAVPLDKRKELLAFDSGVTVYVMRTKKNLPDLVDIEAGSLKHREYVNTDWAKFTILNFGSSFTAYAQRDGVVFIFTGRDVNRTFFDQLLQTVLIS